MYCKVYQIRSREPLGFFQISQQVFFCIILDILLICDVQKLGMNKDDDPKKVLGKTSMFSSVTIGFEPPFLFSCVIPVKTIDTMDSSAPVCETECCGFSVIHPSNPRQLPIDIRAINM